MMIKFGEITLRRKLPQLNPSEANAVLGLGNIYVRTGICDATIEVIVTLYPLH
jgi:hypothetical protein